MLDKQSWKASFTFDTEVKQINMQIEGKDYATLDIAPIAALFSVKYFKKEGNDFDSDYM